MEFEMLPPIEVTGNGDAKKIGQSQANLHKARYEAMYKKQGFDTEVRYSVEKNGKLVRLFVNLIEI